MSLSRTTSSALDFSFVGADQTREIDGGIEDADLITTPEQRLGNRHHRTAAHVIRVRLESEAEQSNTPRVLARDLLQQRVKVSLIRGDHMLKQRQVHAFNAGKPLSAFTSLGKHEPPNGLPGLR